MNFFKRKTRRTTLTISDQTKSSHASLSSGEGTARSLQGSTGTLRKADAGLNGFEDGEAEYHQSETVLFEDLGLIKGSAKLPRKRIKHAHFSEDTNENNNITSSFSSHNAESNMENPEESSGENFLRTEQPRDMTMLGHPGPNLVQNLTPEVTGTPMSLYAAVIKGDKTELKKIISANPEFLDSPDNFGRTPLMYCVLADRLDCAKFLIKMGCKLDKVDNAGRSAIHSAAHKGSYKFLELLQHRGALIDIKDHDGQTALHLATRNRNAKCLEFLLRHVGPGMVDVQDNQMRTALHWSAAYNNTECVKLLIKYGINIAIPDGDGKTPLHWAANTHDPSVVYTMSALLEKSPGVVNWQDYQGRTVLHFAVAGGNSDAVELLVNFEQLEYHEPYKCDVDRSDNTFRTSLHWAAQLGHDHIVKLLLDAGAKNSSSDANGATPFLYAASNNNYSVVETMISHDKAVLQQVDIEGRNALMWAAGKGANDVIRIFLGIKEDSKDQENQGGVEAEEQRNGEIPGHHEDSKKRFHVININKNDNKQNTALHVASLNGQGSSVELLLSHGAQHDLPNHMNHTPVFGACEKGHLRVVKYLLDYNASIDLVDSECRSPLHWAALGGHAEVCEVLIKEGLDVDIRDRLDRTPLHRAAFSGFINCMNLLLENGSNVDLQDQEGRSALHWAAQSGHLDATKLLFQYAVFPNPMEYTEERLTPLDHALQKEKEEVAQYLIEQGALSAENIRNIAATNIQACFRGYQMRKTFLERKQLIKKMLRERELRKESKKDKDKTRGKKLSEGQGSDDGGRNHKETSLSPLALQNQLVNASSVASDATEEDEQKETAETTKPQTKEESPIEKTEKEKSDELNNNESPSLDAAPVQASVLEIEPPISETSQVSKLSDTSQDETIHFPVASYSHPYVHPETESKTTPSAENEDPDFTKESPKTEKVLKNNQISNAGFVEQQEDNKLETDATPEDSEKTKNKEVKRHKKKKSRPKKTRKTEDSDTDEPKTAKVSAPSSPMSLRSDISNKNTSREQSQPFYAPVPPPPDSRNKKPKRKTEKRNRTLVSPRSYTPSVTEYPALDTIGNEDNIHSETVTGLAYKSQPRPLPLFDDQLPVITPAPAVPNSTSLELSEYIEGLMNLSLEDQKVIKEHQRSRRKAFKIAINAAKVIQRAWWRSLWRKNPYLRNKFRHARKKALRLEKKKARPEVPAIVLPQEVSPQSEKKGSASSDSTDRRTRKSRSTQKKKLRPSVASNSETSVFQDQFPISDVSRSSIASSDIQSSIGSERSSKGRRPTTVVPGQRNAYISVEKLEELSRIYGHPQYFRDILSTNAKTASSLMTLDLNPRGRPVTVAGSRRQQSGSLVNGNLTHEYPLPSERSPRQWVSASDKQRNDSVTKTSSRKVHPRYKSGPPTDFTSFKLNSNPNIDVSHLPLQWQKLYGELQNMAAADSRRKTSARFSYNLGDIGL